jgi:hypothetical protein
MIEQEIKEAVERIEARLNDNQNPDWEDVWILIDHIKAEG